MLEKIKYHQENKKYVKVYRKVSEQTLEIMSGYILAFTNQFVLLQVTGDFKALGYSIIPVWQISKLRFNKVDKYYDKIMNWEKEIENIKIDYPVNLNTWPAIFKSLQVKNMNVIVECEDQDIDTFTIGPITKIGKKYVYIKYFDATGVFEDEPSAINYDLITRVQFDDPYTNVISKYTRHKKPKLQYANTSKST